MNHWTSVPIWFLVLVLIFFIIFTVVLYWVTRIDQEAIPAQNRATTNMFEKKASYTENLLRVMTTPMEIRDMKTNDIGYVKRNFNTALQKMLSIFLPSYFVDVTCKNATEDFELHIHKVKGKKGLVKSRWQVDILEHQVKDTLMIDSHTKTKTNIQLAFEYKDETFHVSKTFRENTVYFRKNESNIAQISYNKKLPPRTIFIDNTNGELPVLLLAGIFEIVKYYE